MLVPGMESRWPLHAGDASLMSSLMASSAPGPKPHGEQQFSRAVSSARQDMGLCTPRAQRAQQKDSSKAVMVATSPPFRDTGSSPEEGMRSTATLTFGDEGGVDLAGERAATWCLGLLLSAALYHFQMSWIAQHQYAPSVSPRGSQGAERQYPSMLAERSMPSFYVLLPSIHLMAFNCPLHRSRQG